jgi:DNA-binding transcriptional regulator YhcF (GntR family)
MQLTAKELKRLIREEFVKAKLERATKNEETETVEEDKDFISMFENSGLTKEDIKKIVLEALNEKE